MCHVWCVECVCIEEKAADHLHIPFVTETIQGRSNDHFKHVKLDLYMNPVIRSFLKEQGSRRLRRQWLADLV